MNSQLFLCPYCKLDLSLINSFTKNNINTQILFHTNCNERNHTNFIKEKFGRFHCTKEQCETHKENLSKYQFHLRFLGILVKCLHICKTLLVCLLRLYRCFLLLTITIFLFHHLL